MTTKSNKITMTKGTKDSKEIKKETMSSIQAKKVDTPTPPKPGSNSWHYFQYEEKVKRGEKYDYQETLNKWRDMSDAEKDKYAESAQAAPRHKALPGAGRSVSAYDVLRRDLSYLAENDMKEELMKINLNTLASKVRDHLENHSYAWGPNGEKWLTTPSEDHYKAIMRTIKQNPSFI
ncbi:MAG: hypothetical protein WD512_13060 [Candidatus Paceibacterota bacterium]